ncbi:MAG: hypothetical protein R3F60_14560 [bacterium]
MNGIKKALAAELSSPSEDFVKYFARQVYGGRTTETMRLQFADIVKRAAQQFINDRINDRLQSAIVREEQADVSPAASPAFLDASIFPTGSSIRTARSSRRVEEVEAHQIIRAILEVTEPSRVALRDGKSYCAILFDDNNRRPIAPPALRRHPRR